MFFYVSLFVACVILAFLALYLYNALADVGKVIYKAFLPSSKGSPTSHLGKVRSRSSINDTQTPWGWKGGDNETRAHRTKTAAPDGASGLDGFLDKHTNETSSVGWPYREEKTGFAGKTYKVTRKTASKKSRPGSNSKQPWGW